MLLDFVTTTISMHYSVGTSTLDMIRVFSILSSSLFTFRRSESPTLLGIGTASCLALSLKQIAYSLGKQLKPSKSSGDLVGISATMLLTLDTSSSVSIAGNQMSALCKPQILFNYWIIILHDTSKL